jgi:tricorn protease-like protein
MEGEGGPCRRLTYLGASTATVLSWTPDGGFILFQSSANQPMPNQTTIWMVAVGGGQPQMLQVPPTNPITNSV